MATNLMRIIRRTASPENLEVVKNYNLHPAAQVVLANRATKYETCPGRILDTGINGLDSPLSLPDVELAAERIADAVVSGEVIGLETDHDVDGVTSHAVIYQALKNFFGVAPDKLLPYIGHRLHEGYGLSDKLADRILAANVRPSLIITADNGSSDEDRIARLLEHGIHTVVTDHHGMPEEGPPKSAYACVSPARPDSQYPDPLIAGVMVSFLLMCVVRMRLIDRGYLNADAPKLTSLLDYVALGTIADCVSLARSQNNRIVINAGLKLIESGMRPCWRVVRPLLGDAAKPVTATDMGFKVGPFINSAGRLDDAMVGVRYLLANTDSVSHEHLMKLVESNNERREIEKVMKDEALLAAKAQADAGKVVMQIRLENGHPGVHGIVASRVVEAFGRPAVCFSDEVGSENVLTASARGIEGTHVRDAMAAVQQASPGLLLRFGGHQGAGGMKVQTDRLEELMELYEGAMAKQVGERVLEPAIFVDGTVPTNQIGEGLIQGLRALEPYGREFEAPLFMGSFVPAQLNAIGADKTHWKMKLQGREGGVFDAIVFNHGTEAPMTTGLRYWVVFSPELNWWKGRATVQLMVRYIERDQDDKQS